MYPETTDNINMHHSMWLFSPLLPPPPSHYSVPFLPPFTPQGSVKGGRKGTGGRKGSLPPSPYTPRCCDTNEKAQGLF